MSETLSPVAENDATLIRVSRDGEQAIFEMSSGGFRIYSTSGDLRAEADNLKSLIAGGSWRVPVDNEPETLVASVFSSDIEEEPEAPRAFRVPEQVRSSIAAKLDEMSATLSPEDLAKAKALASGEPVSIVEVSWISDYFDSNDDADQIRGGFKGRKWAEKIVSDGDPYDPYAKYRMDDDPEYDYMALGPDEDGPMVDTLLQVNWETGVVLRWTSDGFEPFFEDELDSFEHPLVLPIDPESAGVLARWIDENPYQTYDIRDADPEARNLFETAYEEIDFEQVERSAAVIADASGYSPAERSQNAKRQVRNFGGRFSGRQVEQTKKLKGYKKAAVPDGMAVETNPAQSIQTWMDSLAPVTAAAEQGRSQSIAQPAADPRDKSHVHEDKMGEWTGKDAGDKDVDDEKDTGLGDAMYFAIVDADDSTAVLDVVAITRNPQGHPEAWRRVKGTWESDPDTLNKLMSSTPPPVVNLRTPDMVKDVLKQVDYVDANPGALPTDAVTESAPPAINASGFADIETLEGLKTFVNLLELYPDMVDDMTACRIRARNRAKAFNRLDIIPEEWRAATPAERGMELASSSPLFGEYGQVLTAAGHPFQGAKGAERLKHYWTVGEGAAKIRWGTKGDLTRAHRHLAKFVGPDRAWGLAQNYHEAIFGMSNTKHDKLTGQYVSHHGK